MMWGARPESGWCDAGAWIHPHPNILQSATQRCLEAEITFILHLIAIPHSSLQQIQHKHPTVLSTKPSKFYCLATIHTQCTSPIKMPTRYSWIAKRKQISAQHLNCHDVPSAICPITTILTILRQRESTDAEWVLWRSWIRLGCQTTGTVSFKTLLWGTLLYVACIGTHTAGQSDWAGKAAAQFSSTALLWLREIPRRWFTSYYWSYHRPWLVIMKFDLIRSVTVHLCGVFLVAVPFIYWLLLLWNGLWFKWPALTFLMLSRHIPYAMKLDPMSLSAQSASSVNIHTTSRETPHPIQNGVKSLKLYRVSRVSVWSVSLQQFRISWPKALYL